MHFTDYLTMIKYVAMRFPGERWLMLMLHCHVYLLVSLEGSFVLTIGQRDF